MPTGYQITDQHGMYFLTFTVVDWVDIFSRKCYRDIIMESLRHCTLEKELLIFGYVVMTNHLHLIARSGSGKLSDTIRNFKKFTAYKIIKTLQEQPESRREWLLHRFQWNAAQNQRNHHYQVWQQDNHAEEIITTPFFSQKLNYIHMNPVRAGWVEKAEDWLYSSAAYLNGMKEASFFKLHFVDED